MKSIRSIANKTVPFVGNGNHNGGLLRRFKPGPTPRQLGAMGESHILFGIVDSIAESVSGTDWKLYRKSTDGRRRYGEQEENRQEVTKHAALDLWNQPNRFMSRQEFVEVQQQHYELTGEAWWLTVKAEMSGLGPMELWPLRPDKMEPVPHRTEYLAGYVYHGPDGEDVPLDLDEIIFLRRPNPIDSYRGFGPVQTILADIDSNRLSAEWNRNFFFNSAQPGGMVRFDRRLDDGEWREFQERWREGHQGVSNAHRVATLENGADWVEAKYTHKDMQFSELSTVSEEKIRKAYRFPKPMLGSVDDVNRANAEAGEVVYARWIIKKRLDRIKQALNNDLLPMFSGPFGDAKQLEFDYCNPVPDDRDADNAELTSKASAAKTLMDAGFHEDDVLSTVGLPIMRYVGRRDNGPEQPAGAEEQAPADA
jgi:HK97 family phage portal protein